MGERVSLSGEQLSINQIASHFDVIEAALRSYYQTSTSLNLRFIGYTHRELADELAERLEEEGRMLAMSALAAVEAAFRIDYLQRVYERR